MKKLALLACLLLVGCANPEKRYRIDNIVRLFYSGNYTAMIEDPATKIITTKFLQASMVIADVPPGMPMWAEPDDTKYQYWIIHIHSANDVNGGNTGGDPPVQFSPVK